jgi:hypothetical protein
LSSIRILLASARVAPKAPIRAITGSALKQRAKTKHTIKQARLPSKVLLLFLYFSCQVQSYSAAEVSPSERKHRAKKVTSGGKKAIQITEEKKR